MIEERDLDIAQQIAGNLEIIQKYRMQLDSEKEDLGIEIKSFSPSQEVMDLVAIDGSYSFVLNLSSMWLAIIRVGALHYRFSEDGGYKLMDSFAREKPVLVSTKKDIMLKSDYVRNFDFTNGYEKGTLCNCQPILSKNLDCVELVYDYNSGHLELPCS